MCGIFAVVGDRMPNIEVLKKYFMSMQARGPDRSTLKYLNDNAVFGFHRLSIVGLENGNQPLIRDNCMLICNGEIYNYRELAVKYSFEITSGSDCEVILHMYQKFGIERTVKELDGVFAFVLYDTKAGVFVARDPIGIRPLFVGIDSERNLFAFASEMKSIGFCKVISQFEPGNWWHVVTGKIPYFSLSTPKVIGFNYKQNIRKLLKSAVKKRMMSDRPIGALLSGGLDSSLIAGLVQKYSDRPINTYAIGMEGSPDLKYADIVSKYIGSNHKNLIVSPKGFIDAIEQTIFQIESYDVTTVRASVGNYVVSKWISQNSDDKVIFCGDVSDEIFGGYRGFSQAPTDESLHLSIIKMVKNIHYFDVLRSDRSISGAGLEARIPYADKDFLEYVMSIPVAQKRFGKLIDKTILKPKIEQIDDEDNIDTEFSSENMEKYILRAAFEKSGLIPDEILWRRKEAFSDGVSGERDWFAIIQDHVEELYTDEEYEEKSSKYGCNPPYDKESLWYREIFENIYPNRGNVIPYFWKHPFCTESDPSARKLDCY